jgi:hypothetical protein
VRPECGELRPITLRILPTRGCAIRTGENGARSNQKAWWLGAVWAAFAVGQLYGQILHATGPLPSFEGATVKPSNGDNATPPVSTATESRTINVTARNLIEQAYGIPWTSGRNERVVGGASWIDNNRYVQHTPVG